ncbi:MAG: hypothetical protein M3O70_26760 [Actinomycetota bacterium]|nr:hypothetical protein [Actinomycetota bacterium]
MPNGEPHPRSRAVVGWRTGGNCRELGHDYLDATSHSRLGDEATVAAPPGLRGEPPGAAQSRARRAFVGRVLALVVVVLVAAAATVVWLLWRGDEPNRAGGGVARGLCDATQAATAGNPEVAEAYFWSVHEPLHALAADVADVDRPVAARILEAKQRVEAAFQAPPPPPADLPYRLRRLTSAVAAGLAAVGTPPPRCLQE